MEHDDRWLFWVKTADVGPGGVSGIVYGCIVVCTVQTDIGHVGEGLETEKGWWGKRKIDSP